MLVRTLSKTQNIESFVINGHAGAVSYKRFTLRFGAIGCLFYHSPKPTFDGESSSGPCKFLECRNAYCDGTSITDYLDVLSEDDTWLELENYYFEVFGGENLA